MKTIFLSLLFLNLTALIVSGQDSLQISLLSCSPGSELYSTFGHSAIRMKDLKSGKDYVFNYGTFNFKEKNFYLKFMQGKLKYLLSVEPMDNFLYSYMLENRTVYEQVLHLDREQKSALFYALQLNAMPANRAYKYDFFWDNCSTRIRDQFDWVYHDSIQYPVRSGITFRDYLHKYLTNQPWSRFGIDLILGLPCDAKTHTREAMFLPLEMMDVYDSAFYQHHELNTKSKVIQAAVGEPVTKPWLTPFLVFGILMLLVIGTGMFKIKVFNVSSFFYNIIMITVGIAGLIICFLWFISEHTTTDNNLHLIWANPLALLYPFRKKIFNPINLQWLSRGYILLLLVLIVSYPVFPQRMPTECIVIWLSLIWITLQDTGLRIFPAKYLTSASN